MLHVAAGGTLVVRPGSTLTVNGTLLLDKGAYVCISDPTSLLVGVGGQFTATPGFYRYPNPALGLDQTATPPSCSPAYPPCTPTLYFSYYTSGGRQAAPGQRTSPQPNLTTCDRVYTITAEGEGLSTNFSWTVDGLPYTALPGHPDQINLVVHSTKSMRDIAVTVDNLCDGQPIGYAETLEADFPNCRTAAPAGVAMYPNPAGSTLDFEQPASSDPAAPTPAGEYEVRLYDGQGQLRWHGRSSGGQLHLASGSLPRGLYGVVITQGASVTRRTLSLE